MVFFCIFFPLCEVATSYWRAKKPLLSAMTEMKIFSSEKHSTTPDYTKFKLKNIYFLNKIKKPQRPNTGATHTAGVTPLPETQRRSSINARRQPKRHCRRPKQPANSLPQTRTTPHCRFSSFLVSPILCSLVFLVFGFSWQVVANFRRRSPGTSSFPPFNLSPRLPPSPPACRLDSNASEYKARSRLARPRPAWSRAAGRWRGDELPAGEIDEWVRWRPAGEGGSAPWVCTHGRWEPAVGCGSALRSPLFSLLFFLSMIFSGVGTCILLVKRSWFVMLWLVGVNEVLYAMTEQKIYSYKLLKIYIYIVNKCLDVVLKFELNSTWIIY